MWVCRQDGDTDNSEDDLMRRLQLALLAFVVLVGFANTAHAQSSTRPGFSTTVLSSVPTPIGKSGIIVKIVDGYGKPVKGAELVVSPMRRDPLTYEEYEDLGSAKRYGQCTSGTSGCVQMDGVAEISFAMLPLDNSGQWADIVVRAEAPNGFIHGIWDVRRVQVQANGRPEYLAPIYMYDYGFATYQTTMWWESKNVIVIGTLVRSPYAMNVSIGFSFEGSSYTKTAVKYGEVNTSEYVDAGWTWVEKRFYAPQTSNMSYYDGAFCGEMQITSQYTQEWVYDKTKKVCVAQR